MSHRRRPACEMNLAFRRMSRHNCDSGAPEGGHQSRSVLRGESSRSQQMKQSGWHRRVRARQWPPRPVAAGGFVRRWPPRSERSGWRGDHEPSTPGTCGARRGADGSYAAPRCPPGHRLGIHPEHQGDPPGVRSRSGFSMIMISSSGRRGFPRCRRRRVCRCAAFDLPWFRRFSRGRDTAMLRRQLGVTRTCPGFRALAGKPKLCKQPSPKLLTLILERHL